MTPIPYFIMEVHIWSVALVFNNRDRMSILHIKLLKSPFFTLVTSLSLPLSLSPSLSLPLSLSLSLSPSPSLLSLSCTHTPCIAEYPNPLWKQPWKDENDTHSSNHEPSVEVPVILHCLSVGWSNYRGIVTLCTRSVYAWLIVLVHNEESHKCTLSIIIIILLSHYSIIIHGTIDCIWGQKGGWPPSILPSGHNPDNYYIMQ